MVLEKIKSNKSLFSLWLKRVRQRRRNKIKMSKKKPNIKVIIYSILALGFLVLTFLVDWIFIIGVVILIYLNKKELIGKK